MTHIGYTISSEEHGPNELVDHAVRAEEVGFEFASISDHYLEQFADAGYDHVYVHQIGPGQDSFFRFYEDEVLPDVR
jgi:alkanesulfonate monooxygenase SsuD/methylene tetrahydromethanopterin reductase-like flavin-dependent oxidoreductase (luciferase family)